MADAGLVPGDWALVHASIALNTLDEHDAREALAILQQIRGAYPGSLC